MGNVHMEAAQVNYRGGSKKMSVEEAIKNAGSEITPEEKTWIDSIPTLATSNAGKTDQTVIAPEFDAEAGTYSIGDLVMHEGKLYEFTSAHETPGDWDETEVTEKTVSDEIDTLRSGLTNLATKLTDLDVFRIQASSGAGVIQFSEINASATTAGRLPFIILINNQSNAPTLVTGNAYAHQSTGIKDMRFSSADVTYNTETMTMTIDAGNNAYSTSLLISPRGLFKVAT